MPNRTYLDWNATAPLRPEARAAMIEAMDVVGNPSSVHTEGRAAKMIVEKAREKVTALVGCDSEEVVFTSGATEAAAAILSGGSFVEVGCADTEHDCILGNIPALFEVADTDDLEASSRFPFEVDINGRIHDLTSLSESRVTTFRSDILWPSEANAVCSANGETGILNDVERFFQPIWGTLICDATQSLGKCNLPKKFFENNERGQANVHYLVLSGHKFGGPKGTGALVDRRKIPVKMIDGGGQEKGRRSGTENVIGIAGFGAAAEAAQRDLDAGAWEPIEELRDDLEAALRDCAGDDLTIFGESAPRLPNTSCFAIPGWKGETQVMQLDLAGFAVSAGSACSSGKVGPSRVLKAMGYDDITASSAIRVSMGPTTTKDEVSRFIDAWTSLYKRMKTRAA